jgi:hypothetical protein
MTNQQLVKHLTHTYLSIANHTQRGGTLKSIRGQVLVDRYNALRSAAIQSPNGGVWRMYCIGISAHISHNGYDLFA